MTRHTTERPTVHEPQAEYTTEQPTGHATATDSVVETRHTRRNLLKAVSIGAVAGLAGCLGGGDSAGDQSRPDPIDLSGGKRDDSGGMIIGGHFGPNGQIFYRDHTPDAHDNPAWFHTLSMGLFPYYFDHQRQGWEAIARYVTDYSSVEYELTEENGQTYISTHTSAETFGDATEMTYVVESDVHGGMGPDLHPFSSADEAESFASDHGGSTVSFDEITPEWISSYLSRE